MFVISKGSVYQELIKESTPKITEASLVHGVYEGSAFEFVYGGRILNQVSVAESSPKYQPFPAIPNVRPLIWQQEIGCEQMTLSGVAPFFPRWNHASMSQNIPLQSIVWNTREIIQRIEAVGMVFKAQDFGSRLPIIAKTYVKPKILRNVASNDALGSDRKGEKKPRSFSAYDGLRVQRSSLGGLFSYFDVLAISSCSVYLPSDLPLSRIPSIASASFSLPWRTSAAFVITNCSVAISACFAAICVCLSAIAACLWVISACRCIARH
jgi:hypothetical protein